MASSAPVSLFFQNLRRVVIPKRSIMELVDASVLQLCISNTSRVKKMVKVIEMNGKVYAVFCELDDKGHALKAKSIAVDESGLFAIRQNVKKIKQAIPDEREVSFEIDMDENIEMFVQRYSRRWEPTDQTIVSYHSHLRKREYDTKGFAKNLGRGTSFSTEELELMNDSFFDKIENFMTMFELPRNVTYLARQYRCYRIQDDDDNNDNERATYVVLELMEKFKSAETEPHEAFRAHADALEAIRRQQLDKQINERESKESFKKNVMRMLIIYLLKKTGKEDSYQLQRELKRLEKREVIKYFGILSEELSFNVSSAYHIFGAIINDKNDNEKAISYVKGEPLPPSEAELLKKISKVMLEQVTTEEGYDSDDTVDSAKITLKSAKSARTE